MNRYLSFAGSASILLPAAVGFWSIGGQFIFNRIIFFYVANSEYAAASIISLHLLGFFLGSLAARRFDLSIIILTAASLATTAGAQLLLWTLGAAALGLNLTLLLTVTFATLTAFLAGFLTIRLIDSRSLGVSPAMVLIADTAGSVLGALVGGFLLIPLLGIRCSFALVAALQAISLLGLSFTQRKSFAFSSVLVCIVAVIAWPNVIPAPANRTLLSVDGLPLTLKIGDAAILFEKRSPYGVVSITGNAEQRDLMIDNHILCSISRSRDPAQTSDWAVGALPAALALKGAGAPSHPYLAMVGLGCGTSLSAALAALPGPPSAVDVIEINAKMPEAQKLFDDALPHRADDPRVNFIIGDGFKHFAKPPSRHLYDGVIIDVAWMHNMNSTHLFSQEMYRNVARHMTGRAVLGVWSEEQNPFSPTALIIYRTLKSVFTIVVVDLSFETVIFYASNTGRPDIMTSLPEKSRDLTYWVDQASLETPVNRLDNLVMNRRKFTAWGDSTFDRLRERYAFFGQQLQ